MSRDGRPCRAPTGPDRGSSQVAAAPPVTARGPARPPRTSLAPPPRAPGRMPLSSRSPRPRRGHWIGRRSRQNLTDAPGSSQGEAGWPARRSTRRTGRRLPPAWTRPPTRAPRSSRRCGARSATGWRRSAGRRSRSRSARSSLLVWLSRDMTFYHDEYTFILLRDLSIDGIFAPHNEHLSATLVILYRVLLGTVGIGVVLAVPRRHLRAPRRRRRDRLHRRPARGVGGLGARRDGGHAAPRLGRRRHPVGVPVGHDRGDRGGDGRASSSRHGGPPSRRSC